MTLYIVKAKALHLRRRPELADNIIATLDQGRRVELLSQTEHWMEVRVVDTSDTEVIGWVAMKYVERSEAPAPIRLEEFPWMALAELERGQKEDPRIDANGRALANGRIVEYLSSVTLGGLLAGSDETPWCSAFVNWCVEQAGYAGTNSALARSWLHWGRPLVKPRRGCIGVFSRVTPEGREGGHVAFYEHTLAASPTGPLMPNHQMLGGNQHDSVCSASYAGSRLLGWRAP